MKTPKMGRRAVLRGIGGVAVALPALDLMLDDDGTARADGHALPKRFMVATIGSSLGSGRTSIDETYVPSTTGFGYDLKTALAPLMPVRDEVSVVTELRIPWAGMNSGRVPAGGRPDNHHETMVSPLLSGVRTPDGRSTQCFGPTADQIVADALAGDTRFHDLAYGIQASTYLGSGGTTSRGIISYRDGGGIGVAADRVIPQVSPKAAFDALFYNFGDLEDPEAQARREFEWQTRRSILDVVMRRSERLRARLGTVDQHVLERHFDEIRDLERRVATLPPDPVGACTALPDPGPDPDFGGNRAASGDSYPYDISNGYSDEDTRARIFMDLIHMAFTCDLTRSVSLCMSHFHSWMNVYELIGVASDLHELGHGNGGTPAQAQALAWHYGHIAYLIEKLRDTPEGSGSVLDNVAMVVTHEGGYGLDPSDGNTQRSHSTERMACLIAGRAGGMRNGQHVRTSNAHPAQCLITAMNAVGVPGGLGEVDGRITDILP